MPNIAGFVHHQHVDEEQQAAAEIAERVAVAGNESSLARLRDVGEQRVVELIAAARSRAMPTTYSSAAATHSPLRDRDTAPPVIAAPSTVNSASRLHARAALVRDRAEERREQRDDQARDAVREPEPERALGRA